MFTRAEKLLDSQQGAFSQEIVLNEQTAAQRVLVKVRSIEHAKRSE
jgi:hypothetical protein